MLCDASQTRPQSSAVRCSEAARARKDLTFTRTAALPNRGRGEARRVVVLKCHLKRSRRRGGWYGRWGVMLPTRVPAGSHVATSGREARVNIIQATLAM